MISISFTPIDIGDSLREVKWSIYEGDPISLVGKSPGGMIETVRMYRGSKFRLMGYDLLLPTKTYSLNINKDTIKKLIANL